MQRRGLVGNGDARSGGKEGCREIRIAESALEFAAPGGPVLIEGGKAVMAGVGSVAGCPVGEGEQPRLEKPLEAATRGEDFVIRMREDQQQSG